jgi:hypothetical protein
MVGGGHVGDEKLSAVIAGVSRDARNIMAYFLSIYFGAALLGAGAHTAVRGLKLDRRVKLLRFQNPWHYVLRGEVSPDQDEPDYRAKFDGVFLSATMTLGEKTYIYWGFIQEFFFDNRGNLDRIVLIGAQRREISSDSSGEDDQTLPIDDARYYSIRGDFLILKYADISTINLEYFSIVESSD